MATLVAQQTAEFVQNVGCSNCQQNIPLNNGLTLECRMYDDRESEILRARALMGSNMVSSGVARILNRSEINANGRIFKRGINVGPIRTADSGAAGFRECRHNYESFSVEYFEKKFYVMPTEKKLKLCVKEFVGTKWSTYLRNEGAGRDDFMAEFFAQSDMADILVAAIIEQYDKFVPEFVLLSTQKSESENGHGDDGIMAKMWYQQREQHFHTLQFDMSELDAAGQIAYLRVNGKTQEFAFDTYGSIELVMTAIFDWLSALKWRAVEYMFDVSGDAANAILTVASAFAVQRVELDVIIADSSTVVEWGCNERSLELPYEELVPNMLINDVPLLFNYSEITEQNFAQMFKYYLKEYKRYLHRNGFDVLTMSNVRILIDPELLLEREGQQQNIFLRFNNTDADTMSALGLSENTFVPEAALNQTGLFLITMLGNLTVLADPSNINGVLNASRIRVKEICEENGDYVAIQFENPLGSDVEHFGLTAANLCGSPFIEHNDLDSQIPLRHTQTILPCFDSSCRTECATKPATCTVAASIEYDAVYDGTNTEITVDINALVANEGFALAYDTNWSLSDGTSGTSSAESFVITIPGDQTASGLVLNVQTIVQASDPDGVGCTTKASLSERLGDGDGSECSYAGTSNAGSVTSLEVVLNYTTGGSDTIPLTNAALDIDVPADFAAIEAELEAIIPGADATLTGGGGSTGIAIDNVTTLITSVTFAAVALTRTC